MSEGVGQAEGEEGMVSEQEGNHEGQKGEQMQPAQVRRGEEEPPRG